MDVNIDFNDFVRGLDDLAKRQVPFATAKTLTDVAKLGQMGVRRKTREAFDLHTDFIPSQVVITPAKTADAKSGKARAEVRGTDKIGFMTIHEDGGTRRPIKGTALAIPTFTAQKKIPNLRTRTGRIRPKFMPKRLLEGWPQGTNRGFTEDGLLFAKKSKRGEVMPMFDFERSAEIDARWGFEEEVRQIVGLQASSLFRRNLLMAMASSKR